MRALALSLLLFAGAAAAHPLAPALLELVEVAPERYAVHWRTAVARVGRSDVTPELPCPQAAPVRSAVDGEALSARWIVDCSAGGLAGKTVGVAGIEAAGINVVVRIERSDGAVMQGLLDRAQPAQAVTFTAPRSVLEQYLLLGIQHLLGGLDHVLFVLGLVLLVRGARSLLVTITAFTFGHSLTLALAALGYLRFDPRVAEVGIALSLLVVALQLAQPVPARWHRPARLAAAFGLLHGLGFASALAGAGLPANDIPLALLAFNLGIELGQLALVAVLLLLGAAARTIHGNRPALAASATAYVIGSLAVLWCIERAADLTG